jgi:hypothetical protein
MVRDTARIRNLNRDQAWWLKPVILATQETDWEDFGSRPA